MMTKSEKLFCTGASLFFSAFGLATCDVSGFCIGFLSGAATLITIAAWNADNK